VRVKGLSLAIRQSFDAEPSSYVFLSRYQQKLCQVFFGDLPGWPSHLTGQSGNPSSSWPQGGKTLPLLTVV